MYKSYRIQIFILMFFAQGSINTSQAEISQSPQKQEIVRENPLEVDAINKKVTRLYLQHKFTEAEKEAKTALDLITRKTNPTHPAVAISLHNLALIYHAQVKYDKAEFYYKWVLEIFTKNLKPDRIKVGNIKKYLSMLSNSRGEYVKEGELFNRAKSILEKDLLPDHPDVAIVLNNLATLFRNQGKYDKAESFFKKALLIWVKTFEQDHDKVGIAMKNLEIVYSDKKEAKQNEMMLSKIEEENNYEDILITINKGNPLKGQETYELYCAGCHGMDGKGNGSNAIFLNPKPRDFTIGDFKIRTTPAGKLPTDKDLFDIISKGMPGTAMPEWKKSLSDEEIANVLQYIKSFSSRKVQWNKKGGSAHEISIGSEVLPSFQSIIKGRNLFIKLRCWKCHGMSGRGNGPQAPTSKDDLGNQTQPRNFHKLWNLRGGNSNRAIYERINTGLSGTPMRSFADKLNNEKSWHLANFIASLGPEKEPEIQEVIVSKLITGDIPMDHDHPLWQFSNKYFFPLVGAVVLEAQRFWSNIDSIYVKSLYNDTEIAFLLEWDDPTKSPIKPFKKFPEQCNDAFFLQFPIILNTITSKPYFFPGDMTEDTDIWFWESSNNKCRNLISKISEERKLGAAKNNFLVNTNPVYKDGRWLMVMKRKIKNKSDQQMQFETDKFIPISFHAQDGLAGDAAKKSFIPIWRWLILQRDVISERNFTGETAIVLKLAH